MTHLDDLCPSPSQEARELQGDEPSAMVQPPKPVAMPPPPVPDSARKPTGGASRFSRPAPKASTPMAPPPRPKPVRPAAAMPAEIPDMPFFSTQDLLFSSQDLRDIDEPKTTPFKMGGKRAHGNPPPFKPWQPPSPFGQSSKPPQQPAPRFCPKPSPASDVTPSRAAARPQQVAQKPEPVLRQTPPVSEHLGTSQPSQPTPCPAPVVGRHKADMARENPPRAPSPEKLRFFGSSGGGIDLLRAVCESRKSHQEEESRRQAAQQPTQTKQAPQQRHQTRNTAGQDTNNKGSDVTEPDIFRRPPPPTANRTTKPATQGKADPTGDRPTINTHAASQETDYGDVELDSMDFDELGLDIVQMPAAPEPKQEVGEVGEGEDDAQDARPEIYDFLDQLDEYWVDYDYGGI